MGERGESLSLYKGGRSCAPPHLPVKIIYSPSAVIDGAVGLPIPTIDENPMIRGHDLYFDKTCQGNRLALRAMAGFEERFG